MAMTNALNYGVEKIPEIFLYQMIKQTVSSPGFINEAAHLSLLIRNQLALNSPLPSKKHNDFITTRERLMLISAFFGFSKSRLGEIFGVTRQSIYNWFDNIEPDIEHYEKIQRLADVVLEVDPAPSQSIFHVYLKDIIKGYSKSLFDYLLDDDFNKDTVIRLSKTLYEMSKERWKRIDAIPKAKYGSSVSVP
jgi:transcriptional regulator with XRE-family HTH domain